MNRKELIVRHLGRKSMASVTASRAETKAFLETLLANGFFMESNRQSHDDGTGGEEAGEKETWVLGRKIQLMAGDWPMKVFVEREREEVRISYFMFTPWGWVITLAIMLLFFLPFTPIQGRTLVFFMGFGVIAAAIYKRRWDLSPDASWQAPPRERWNDKMIRFLTDAFGEPPAQ